MSSMYVSITTSNNPGLLKEITGVAKRHEGKVNFARGSAAGSPSIFIGLIQIEGKLSQLLEIKKEVLNNLGNLNPVILFENENNLIQNPITTTRFRVEGTSVDKLGLLDQFLYVCKCNAFDVFDLSADTFDESFTGTKYFSLTAFIEANEILTVAELDNLFHSTWNSAGTFLITLGWDDPEPPMVKVAIAA